MAQKPVSKQVNWPLEVSCVVFDFDGVMTDNLVSIDSSGNEFVTCSRSDGMGIEKLRSIKLPMLVLSKEKNPVVTARCEKLKIPCLQGIEDKMSILMEWFLKNNLNKNHFIFVGNDENDTECLKAAAFAIVPRDAHYSALPFADLQLTYDGGKGAVRELCDQIYDKVLQGKIIISKRLS